MDTEEWVSGVYPEPKLKTNDSQLVGDGWRAFQEGGEYYFEYLIGRMGGGTETVSITAEEYESVRNGQYTYQTICEKFGVFK